MPALDPASPTALDTRPAFSREWETCADYYEGPIACIPSARVGASQLDPRINSLVAEDFSEPESLMGSLQRDLRRGARTLVANLITVTRDVSMDSRARALALETLAGARVRTIEPEVRDVIIEVIEQRDAEMQFAAVAAASDLSRQSQVMLAGAIRGLLRSASVDYWVRRAAVAFLDSL